MKRENIINFLNKNFPKTDAFDWDYIGLQIEGKEEVKTILVTLDITLDIILEAVKDEVNMIITHHPFFFGDKEQELSKNPLLKAKYDLLISQGINVFVIHTNADFNQKNSIAINQAKLMGLLDIEQINSNKAVFGKFKKVKFESSLDLVSYIKNALRINYLVNTNILNKANFNGVYICSGACGEIVYHPEVLGNLIIVGEMKHHHWVYANEMNIDVIEIGHFTEIIFKKIISDLLNILQSDDSNLKILESIEENGYTSI